MPTRFEKADRKAQELAERMHRPDPKADKCVTTKMLAEMLDLHPSSATRVARAYGFPPDRRRLPNKNRTWVLAWSLEAAEAIKARREADGSLSGWRRS